MSRQTVGSNGREASGRQARGAVGSDGASVYHCASSYDFGLRLHAFRDSPQLAIGNSSRCYWESFASRPNGFTFTARKRPLVWYGRRSSTGRPFRGQGTNVRFGPSIQVRDRLGRQGHDCFWCPILACPLHQHVILMLGTFAPNYSF